MADSENNTVFMCQEKLDNYIVEYIKGNKDILYDMGRFFYDIEKNYVLAKFCFTEGAENNNIACIERLKDLEHIEDLYDVQINAGSCPDNILFISTMGTHYDGTDYNKAMYFYKICADNGDYCSMYNMGRCYHHHDKGRHLNEIKKYYKRAIEGGLVMGYHGLGFYYETIKNDIYKAVKYYKIGSKKDNAECAYNVGIYYGETVNNARKAIKYFTRATELGDSDAFFQLGKYFDILGDDEESIRYLNLSVETGNVDAMIKLAKHYREIDPDLTIKYYDMAINHNYNIAVYDLVNYMISKSRLIDSLPYLKKIIDLNLITGHYRFTPKDRLNQIIKNSDDLGLYNAYYDYLDDQNNLFYTDHVRMRKTKSSNKNV